MPRSRLLILSILVLLVFSGTTSNGFIGLDDPEYITNNVNVIGGLTAAGLRWAVTSVDYFYWQPVTWISHMIDVSLYGLNAGGHHFTNALLHSINAVILALAFYQLTGLAGRSLALAALFAFHPLRVESVAWVAERKDLLAGLFFLLGILAYAKYVKKPSPRALAFVAGAYVLALASKPTSITFPFVLLLLDYWPLNRIRPVWPVIREKLPLFALTIASAVLTYVGQKLSGAVVTEEVLSLQTRLLNVPISYVKYLLKFFWPHPLVVYYPIAEHIEAWQAGIAALVLVLITVLLFWKRNRAYLLIGWLWFLGVLVPMIGIVQVGLQAYAERFTYLSMIGLSMAVVWLGTELLPKARQVYIAIGACTVLALASWVQIGHWKDSVTLFGHALRYEPDNPLMQNNLASALMDRQHVDEALPLLEKTVKMSPRYVDAWTNLGIVYSKKSRPDEAIQAFREAVRRDPNFAKSRLLLATILMEQEQFDEALKEHGEALKLPLTSADAAKTYSDMGLILVRKHSIDEAITHFRKALEYQPMLLAARRNLAGALLEKNQPEAALEQIEYAIRQSPRDPELRQVREAIISRLR